MTRTYIVQIERTAKLAPSTLLSTITDALNGITMISVVDVDAESPADTTRTPMSQNNESEKPGTIGRVYGVEVDYDRNVPAVGNLHYNELRDV